MENKTCKKCGRTLPMGYKYKRCESCRNGQVKNVKTGVKTTVGVVGAAASLALFVMSNGKIDLKK